MPQDYSDAARWIRMAAETGLPEAQWTLALMYGRGQGVPKDRRAAMEWMQMAAERCSKIAEQFLQWNNEELLNIILQYPVRPVSGETTVKAY